MGHLPINGSEWRHGSKPKYEITVYPKPNPNPNKALTLICQALASRKRSDVIIIYN